LPNQEYEDGLDGTASAREKALESRSVTPKSRERPILGARSEDVLDSIARLLATPDGVSQLVSLRGRVFERADGRIRLSGNAFEQRDVR
jgi:hypothetical protein